MRHISLIILLVFIISCSQQPKNQNQPVVVDLHPTDSVQIDSLNKLIKNNPQQADLYGKRAKLHFKTGNLANAISDYLLANRLDSLNAEYYCNLADLYLQMGRSEVTRDLLQKANRLIPSNVQVVYRLGNLYFYVKDYKKAIGYLDEAVNIDPFFAPSYFSRALLYQEKGDTTKAIDNLQFAVERQPEYYDAYMQLGVLFTAKSDSIALAYYRNALRIIPDSYEALYGIAMFYQENGNPEKALETYRYILNHSDEKPPIIYYNMGYVEMTYFEDYTKAISSYDSAIVLKQDFKEAYCNRAFCFAQTGNKSKAIDDYKSALKIDAGFKPAFEGLRIVGN